MPEKNPFIEQQKDQEKRLKEFAKSLQTFDDAYKGWDEDAVIADLSKMYNHPKSNQIFSDLAQELPQVYGKDPTEVKKLFDTYFSPITPEIPKNVAGTYEEEKYKKWIEEFEAGRQPSSYSKQEKLANQFLAQDPNYRGWKPINVINDIQRVLEKPKGVQDKFFEDLSKTKSPFEGQTVDEIRKTVYTAFDQQLPTVWEQAASPSTFEGVKSDPRAEIKVIDSEIRSKYSGKYPPSHPPYAALIKRRRELAKELGWTSEPRPEQRTETPKSAPAPLAPVSPQLKSLIDGAKKEDSVDDIQMKEFVKSAKRDLKDEADVEVAKAAKSAEEVAREENTLLRQTPIALKTVQPSESVQRSGGQEAQYGEQPATKVPQLKQPDVQNKTNLLDFFPVGEEITEDDAKIVYEQLQARAEALRGKLQKIEESGKVAASQSGMKPSSGDKKGVQQELEQTQQWIQEIDAINKASKTPDEFKKNLQTKFGSKKLFDEMTRMANSLESRVREIESTPPGDLGGVQKKATLLAEARGQMNVYKTFIQEAQDNPKILAGIQDGTYEAINPEYIQSNEYLKSLPVVEEGGKQFVDITTEEMKSLRKNYEAIDQQLEQYTKDGQLVVETPQLAGLRQQADALAKQLESLPRNSQGEILVEDEEDMARVDQMIQKYNSLRQEYTSGYEQRAKEIENLVSTRNRMVKDYNAEQKVQEQRFSRAQKFASQDPKNMLDSVIQVIRDPKRFVGEVRPHEDRAADVNMGIVFSEELSKASNLFGPLGQVLDAAKRGWNDLMTPASLEPVIDPRQLTSGTGAAASVEQKIKKAKEQEVEDLTKLRESVDTNKKLALDTMDSIADKERKEYIEKTGKDPLEIYNPKTDSYFEPWTRRQDYQNAKFAYEMYDALGTLHAHEDTYFDSARKSFVANILSKDKIPFLRDIYGVMREMKISEIIQKAKTDAGLLDPDRLTDSEKQALTAIATKVSLEAGMPAPTTMRNTMDMVLGMIPYMAEFAATKGILKGAFQGVKALAPIFAEVGETTLSKVPQLMLQGTIHSGMATLIHGPAEVLEKMNDKPVLSFENGDLEISLPEGNQGADFWPALVDTAISQFSENFTEYMGGALALAPKAFGKLLGRTQFGQELAKGFAALRRQFGPEVSQWLSQATKSNISLPSYLKKVTNWDGLWEEQAEEWVAVIIENIAHGRPITEGLDAKFIEQTFLGIAGFQGLVSMPRLSPGKYKKFKQSQKNSAAELITQANEEKIVGEVYQNVTGKEIPTLKVDKEKTLDLGNGFYILKSGTRKSLSVDKDADTMLDPNGLVKGVNQKFLDSEIAKQMEEYAKRDGERNLEVEALLKKEAQVKFPYLTDKTLDEMFDALVEAKRPRFEEIDQRTSKDGDFSSLAGFSTQDLQEMAQGNIPVADIDEGTVQNTLAGEDFKDLHGRTLGEIMQMIKGDIPVRGREREPLDRLIVAHPELTGTPVLDTDQMEDLRRLKILYPELTGRVRMEPVAEAFTQSMINEIRERDMISLNLDPRTEEEVAQNEEAFAKMGASGLGQKILEKAQREAELFAEKAREEYPDLPEHIFQKVYFQVGLDQNGKYDPATGRIILNPLGGSPRGRRWSVSRTLSHEGLGHRLLKTLDPESYDKLVTMLMGSPELYKKIFGRELSEYLEVVRQDAERRFAVLDPNTASEKARYLQAEEAAAELMADVSESKIDPKMRAAQVAEAIFRGTGMEEGGAQSVVETVLGQSMGLMGSIGRFVKGLTSSKRREAWLLADSILNGTEIAESKIDEINQKIGRQAPEVKGTFQERLESAREEYADLEKRITKANRLIFDDPATRGNLASVYRRKHKELAALEQLAEMGLPEADPDDVATQLANDLRDIQQKEEGLTGDELTKHRIENKLAEKSRALKYLNDFYNLREFTVGPNIIPAEDQAPVAEQTPTSEEAQETQTTPKTSETETQDETVTPQEVQEQVTQTTPPTLELTPAQRRSYDKAVRARDKKLADAQSKFEQGKIDSEEQASLATKAWNEYKEDYRSIVRAPKSGIKKGQAYAVDGKVLSVGKVSNSIVDYTEIDDDTQVQKQATVENFKQRILRGQLLPQSFSPVANTEGAQETEEIPETVQETAPVQETTIPVQSGILRAEDIPQGEEIQFQHRGEPLTARVTGNAIEVNPGQRLFTPEEFNRFVEEGQPLQVSEPVEFQVGDQTYTARQAGNSIEVSDGQTSRLLSPAEFQQFIGEQRGEERGQPVGSEVEEREAPRQAPDQGTSSQAVTSGRSVEAQTSNEGNVAEEGADQPAVYDLDQSTMGTGPTIQAAYESIGAQPGENVIEGRVTPSGVFYVPSAEYYSLREPIDEDALEQRLLEIEHHQYKELEKIGDNLRERIDIETDPLEQDLLKEELRNLGRRKAVLGREATEIRKKFSEIRKSKPQPEEVTPKEVDPRIKEIEDKLDEASKIEQYILSQLPQAKHPSEAEDLENELYALRWSKSRLRQEERDIRRETSGEFYSLRLDPLAIQTLATLDEMDYRLTGNSISPELREKGYINIRGKEVRDIHDLAAISQVFRDPRMEAVRWIMTRGDEVVGTYGTTSMLPYRGDLVPPAFHDADQLYSYLRDVMKQNQADGIYMLHNHPSGNPQPSEYDVSLTYALRNQFGGQFKGSLVIDSNQYGVVAPVNKEAARAEGWQHLGFGMWGARFELDQDFDPLLQPSIVSPLINQRIKLNEENEIDTGDLARRAKALQSDGFVTLIGIGANNGKIQGIAEVREEYLRSKGENLESISELENVFDDFVLNTGSTFVFVVGAQPHPVYEGLKTLQYVTGVMDADGNLLTEDKTYVPYQEIFAGARTKEYWSERQTPVIQEALREFSATLTERGKRIPPQVQAWLRQEKLTDRNIESARALLTKNKDLLNDRAIQLLEGGIHAGDKLSGRVGSPIWRRRPQSEEAYRERGVLTTRAGSAVFPTADRTSAAPFSTVLSADQQDDTNLALDIYESGGRAHFNANGTGMGKTRVQAAVAAQYIPRFGLPVVIVTDSDRVVSTSYKDEFGLFGLSPKRIRSQKDIKANEVYITTYNDLSQFERIPGLFVVDEVQNLRNIDTIKSQHGLQLLDSANHKYGASATPIERVEHLEYFMRFFGLPLTETYRELGLTDNGQLPEVENPELVLNEVLTEIPLAEAQKLAGNVTPANVDLALRIVERNTQYLSPESRRKMTAPLQNFTRRLDKLLDKLTAEGKYTRKELALNGLNVQFELVPLTKTNLEAYDKIADAQLGKNRSVRDVYYRQAMIDFDHRKFIESSKVMPTVELIRQALAEGRQVVVFAERVNDGKIAGIDSKGTIKYLEKRLKYHNIPFSRLHSSLPGQEKAIRDFQSGETKVVVTTPGSGSVGISLDDQVGDAPRTVILMTLPFTSIDLLQELGRAKRSNTKSDVDVKILTTDTESDARAKAYILPKLQTMGATLQGGYGQLFEDLSSYFSMRPSRDTRFEDKTLYYSLRDGSFDDDADKLRMELEERKAIKEMEGKPFDPEYVRPDPIQLRKDYGPTLTLFEVEYSRGEKIWKNEKTNNFRWEYVPRFTEEQARAVQEYQAQLKNTKSKELLQNLENAYQWLDIPEKARELKQVMDDVRQRISSGDFEGFNPQSKELRSLWFLGTRQFITSKILQSGGRIKNGSYKSDSMYYFLKDGREVRVSDHLMDKEKRKRYAPEDKLILNHIVDQETVSKMLQDLMYPPKGEYLSMREGNLVGPVFYSKMAETLDSKLQARGTPEQYKQTIESWVKKGEFKAEELEWSGLTEWLDAQEGQVTKSDIINYLKNNQLEIRDEQDPGGSNVEDARNTLSSLTEDIRSAIDIYVESPFDTPGIYQILDEFDNLADSPNIEPGMQGHYEGLLEKLDDSLSVDEDIWKRGYPDEIRSAMNDLFQGDTDSSKYLQYTSKVNGNYKELLLTFPSTQEYKSSHWDTPNVLVHTRFWDTQDTDGNPALFIDEIQSDWHQEGRKKGYRTLQQQRRLQEITDLLPTKYKELAPIRSRLTNIRGAVNRKSFEQEEAELEKEYNTLYLEIEILEREWRFLQPTSIPDAPFKNSSDWTGLAFKRLMHWAVEHGAEKIAWIDGKSSADRYNLRNQIDELQYYVIADNKFEVNAWKGDQIVATFEGTPEELENSVGKEIAKRISEGEGDMVYTAGEPTGARSLSGEGLEVGGEFHLLLYDTILPSVAKKLTKKYGTSPQMGEVIPGLGEVHYVDVTDKMRESVKGGLPLFSMREDPWRVRDIRIDPNSPIPVIEQVRSAVNSLYGRRTPLQTPYQDISRSVEDLRDYILREGQEIKDEDLTDQHFYSMRENPLALENTESALQDVEFRLLGNAVTPELRYTGSYDAVGQVVQNYRDLAAMSQVFRNPSFEVFRYIFVKGDTVVGQTAITSKLASATGFYPGHKNWEAYREHLKGIMLDSGADGYYLVHNHPSGTPMPSDNDLQTTEWMQDQLPGFKGHVVINSNQYAVIRPVEGARQMINDYTDIALTVQSRPDLVEALMEFVPKSAYSTTAYMATDMAREDFGKISARIVEETPDQLETISNLRDVYEALHPVLQQSRPVLENEFFGEDKLLQPSKDHPWLGLKISKESDVKTLVEQAVRSQSPNLLTIVGLGGTGRVRGVAELDKNLMQDTQKLEDYMRQFSLSTGSALGHLIGVPESELSQYKDLLENALISEIVTDTGRSGKWIMYNRGELGKRFSKPIPLFEVPPMNKYDRPVSFREAQEYYSERIPIADMANALRDLNYTPEEILEKYLGGMNDEQSRTELYELQRSLSANGYKNLMELAEAVRGGTQPGLLDPVENPDQYFTPQFLYHKSARWDTFLNWARQDRWGKFGKAMQMILPEDSGRFRRRSIQLWVDRMYPLLEMQDAAIRGGSLYARGGELFDDLNVYMKEELRYKLIENRMDEADQTYLRPMLQKLAEAGLTSDDLHWLALAFHAQERNEAIGQRNDQFGVTEYEKDEQGNLIQETDEQGNPVFEVDENGQPVIKAGQPVPKYKIRRVFNKNHPQGGGSGISNQTARDVLQWYKDNGYIEFREIDTGIPSLEKGRNRVRYELIGNKPLTEAFRIQQNMLAANRRLMVESDLADAETIQMLEDNYQFYSPLRGLDDSNDGIFFYNEAGREIYRAERGDRTSVSDKTLKQYENRKAQTTSGKALSVGGKEWRSAMGRVSMSENILATSMAAYYDTMVRAENNKVGKTMLKFARLHPTAKSYDGEPLFEFNAPKITRSMDKYGAVQLRYDTEQSLNKVIRVKEGGKTIFLKVNNPRLLQSWNRLDVSTANKFARGMGVVTRFMSKTNTTWDPQFALTNAVRDIQAAANYISSELSTERGFRGKFVKEVYQAGRSVSRARKGKEGKRVDQKEWDEWYREYEESGGATGFFTSKSIDDLYKEQEKMIRRLTSGKVKFDDNFQIQDSKTLKSAIENVNDTFERMTRLAAYRRARLEGYSKEKAASYAKNVTVNFNRRGLMMDSFGPFYMFMNASIQGNWRLLTALKKGKFRKLAMRLTAYSYILGTMNRAMGGTDPDTGKYWWDLVNPGMKTNKIIVMIPKAAWETVFGEGTYHGQSIWFPVPYGFNIAHSLGQGLSDMTDPLLWGKDKRDPVDVAADIVGTTFDSFNPTGSSGSWVQMVSPTVLDPFVQIWENKTWYGSPLYKQEFSSNNYSRPASERFFKSSRLASQEFARWLNSVTGGSPVVPGTLDWSPDIIDMLFDTALGGFGKTSAAILETLWRGAATVSSDANMIEARRAPILSKFFMEDAGDSVTYQEFFDLMTEMNTAKKQIELTDEELGDKEAANRIYQENIEFFEGSPSLYDKGKAVESKLRTIREIKTKLEKKLRDELSILPGVEYGKTQEQLDNLRDQEVAIMSNFLREYREQK